MMELSITGKIPLVKSVSLIVRPSTPPRLNLHIIVPDGTYQKTRPLFFIDPRYDGNKAFEHRLKEFEEELEDERRWLEDYQRDKARHDLGLDDNPDFDF